MYNKHHLALNKPGTTGARKEHRTEVANTEHYGRAAKEGPHAPKDVKTAAEFLVQKKPPTLLR